MPDIIKPAWKHLFLLLGILLVNGTDSFAEPGAAIAIVYDTSGSMSEKVPAAGGLKQKYIIASEALGNIVNKIDAYAKSGNKIQAGIVCFPRSAYGVNAVPFQKWNPEPFRKWLGDFNMPNGGTPLGKAILNASELVADSPLDKKHVVVLTDGENNEGMSADEAVRNGLEHSRKKGGSPISYYFIAFDTKASQFSELKKKGALVLTADNEVQLQKGLTSIFTEKILLEDEDK